jgi:hypothetical protein
MTSSEKLWRHSQIGFSWASNQRKLYHKGCLTRTQIRNLEKDLDWRWEVTDTAAENKAALLEMARSGELRPHSQKHPLGPRLCSYTTKTSSSYDPEFDKEIRRLSPHWFVDTAAENKLKFLEMARNGEPRPHHKNHPLGQSFNSYIKKSHDCYDPEFDKEIRRLAPHWFVDTAAEKKMKLLEMARNGEPRPHRNKHPLGPSFNGYIGKTKGTYDPDFDQEIRRLAPHWFKS